MPSGSDSRPANLHVPGVGMPPGFPIDSALTVQAQQWPSLSLASLASDMLGLVQREFGSQPFARQSLAYSKNRLPLRNIARSAARSSPPLKRVLMTMALRVARLAAPLRIRPGSAIQSATI
jgi:hypothetical protein